MRRTSEEIFVCDLKRLLETEVSIFGLKLADNIHNIICTRVVPIHLNIAAKKYKITIFWREDSCDIIFAENMFTLQEMVKMETPTKLDLRAAVLFVKECLVIQQKNRLNDAYNADLVLLVTELETLVESKTIFSYEFIKDYYETVIYVKAPFHIPDFLRPGYASKGYNCKTGSFVIKMVFEGSQPSMYKFKLQFPPQVQELFKEVKKGISGISFNGVSKFLEDVTTSIEEVLDESRKKYKLREEVILGISGVLVPLGMVRGVDSKTMSEMDICLGEGQFLKLQLKSSFPSAMPILNIFSNEVDEDTGERSLKKKTIRKGDVFNSQDKDVDAIISSIIELIHARMTEEAS